MTPSSTRVGEYVIVARAAVSGSSCRSSTMPIRRPPRVTSRRSAPSAGSLISSSFSASSRTASMSNGSRIAAALRAIRSRCSSSANGSAVVEVDDLEDAVAAQQAFVGDGDLRLRDVHDVAVEDGEVVGHAQSLRGSGAAGQNGSAPARNRTWNLRIKSPLLCQLSYRGWA